MYLVTYSQTPCPDGNQFLQPTLPLRNHALLQRFNRLVENPAQPLAKSRMNQIILKTRCIVPQICSYQKNKLQSGYCIYHK